MAELEARLVLASASPRRREILQRLGFSFEVVPSRVVERRRPGEDAEAYVRRLSADKAAHVAAALEDQVPPPFVLGADTTVVLGGVVLDKPRDDDEARAMIGRLSGETHRVVTGVSIARAGRGDAAVVGILGTVATETNVSFRALSNEEIAAYAATGEGRDKAGAYGIQGLGSGLVTKVDGSYDGVVGLPAAEVIVLLRDVGALRKWP